MEQPLTAHKAGTLTGLAAEVGQTVSAWRRDLRDQGQLTADRPARPRAGRHPGMGASPIQDDRKSVSGTRH